MGFFHISTLDWASLPGFAGAALTVAAFSAAGTQAVPDSSVLHVETLFPTAVEPLPTRLQFPSDLMPTAGRSTLHAATSSSPSTEVMPVPRRRFQTGRVFKRGKKWIGMYRDNEVNPQTGQRIRRTVTFDDGVTSERAARRELQLYLEKVNLEPPSPRRGGKTVSDLIEEWKETVAPNRKAAGLRAALSHIRTHVVPLVGSTPLRDLNVRAHQTFLTAVGLRVSRKKTVENVYGTLSSILAKGRKWGYAIPRVGREDLEFPVDKKPKPPAFFFDADTGARIINAAVLPFRLMFLIAALCYLRIGEVTALKLSSLDFKRKLIHVDSALDYATRIEVTTKSEKSCAAVPMPDLLERKLKDWVEHGHKPNPEGYLFTNSKGKPYRSETVIRHVHRTMDKLGITRPKGVHVGVHCFRHGASSELLDLGTPINVVTRLMRHSDSKTTLNNYAHSVHDSERVASERLSKKIEETIAQLESGSEMESTPLQTV